MQIELCDTPCAYFHNKVLRRRRERQGVETILEEIIVEVFPTWEKK